MLTSFLLATALTTNFHETLYPDWKQTFTIDQIIYEENTDYWNLSIFENGQFGRVLALDGIIQLTEKDEYSYHEMMVHVPILTHPNPKSVLIIGGGDGGSLREVLRHKSLENITQVEIDPTVIELSKTYFPTLSQGAFDDPRANIVIQDASIFVKETEQKFDVIIIDSNDPEGSAQVLFSSEFYGDCKNILNEGGILVNQNGVPFLQPEELTLTENNRKPHFKNVGFYITSVPTYVGGLMALGFASDATYEISEEVLKERLTNMEGKMKYYTPAVHIASFALPQFMMDR